MPDSPWIAAPPVRRPFSAGSSQPLPVPTSRTLCAFSPAPTCTRRVDLAFPSKSPRATTAESAPPAAASTAAAGPLSVLSAATGTTRASHASVAGSPLRIVNCMAVIVR